MRRIKRAQKKKEPKEVEIPFTEVRDEATKVINSLDLFASTLEDNLNNAEEENATISDAIVFIRNGIKDVKAKLDEMDNAERKKLNARSPERVLEISMAQMTLGMDIAKTISSMEGLKSSLLNEALKTLKNNDIEKTME